MASTISILGLVFFLPICFYEVLLLPCFYKLLFLLCLTVLHLTFLIIFLTKTLLDTFPIYFIRQNGCLFNINTKY